MVEELKLAVKVDDDIIEQSLLKQFNNAEKLADKVVFTFKNVNLDNKEIEKQFKDMQRLAGKNPIELPIDTDKSLKMLQALGDEFTRIISIAKGANVNPSKKLVNSQSETGRKTSSTSDAQNSQREAKELQEVWEKNLKIINEYFDANTKLNNLKAAGLKGDKANEIELQEKQVANLREEAIKARAAISSMVDPHHDPISTWDSWLKMMNEFSEASNGSAQSIAKLKDAMAKMKTSQLKPFETTVTNSYGKLDTFSLRENQSNIYIEQLETIRTKIVQLESYKNSLKNNGSSIVSESELNQLKEYESEIKQAIGTLQAMPASEKGSTEGSRLKMFDKISKYLKENSKLSKQAREELESYLKTLKSGDPSVNVDKINQKFIELAHREREAGREGKSFFAIFKDKALYGYAAQLAQYYLGFYDFIRYGKAIVDNVREIDTALTELRKVSDASESRLTQNFKNSAEAAKDLGATVSDLISASADWSRMGYSIDESEELARVSTLYKNVGDGIDIEDANNSLISTLQGYQLVASEAESVVDKYNEVSNNFAITSGGIGEALQRSAASFNAANTDLSKSIALITATNEVVQNPESVGTLWKTLSARIRGASTELSELGEETDEYTESTSKLRDLVKSLTGFDIMQDEDTFKDIYEIIMGIGKEWSNLTDLEQASLGEALAGKRNANALYAVLGNLDTLQEAYETAENSAGSARKEQENYEKSIQYSLDRLTASAQEWSATLVDSEVIKFFVDLANAVVNLSTATTPLGTIGLGAGLFAGIKNVGIDMLVAC